MFTVVQLIDAYIYIYIPYKTTYYFNQFLLLSQFLFIEIYIASFIVIINIDYFRKLLYTKITAMVDIPRSVRSQCTYLPNPCFFLLYQIEILCCQFDLLIQRYKMLETGKRADSTKGGKG